MQNESRCSDLREQRGHVSFTICHKIASGIRRRAGNSLKLIEPVCLLFTRVWNELRCKHLAKRRVFLAPASSHQGYHCVSSFPLCLCPGALLPADSKTSEKY